LIDPEIAREITENIDHVTPVVSQKGPRKGEHVKYGYRFEFSSRAKRHICIARRGTEDGITIYVNKLSVTGILFPEGELSSVKISDRYPKGYKGKTGDKGLSAAAASLPTINPKFNDSLRLSVSTVADFKKLLNWYFGLTSSAPSLQIQKENFSQTSDESLSGSAESIIDEEAQEGLKADTNNLTAAEREAIVKIRYGQGAFRDLLMGMAGAKCWMSGIEGKPFLIASHIKPWSHCDKDPDARGCSDNGLLLSSLWDAAFDSGLITFDESWKAITSPFLSVSAKNALGINQETALPEMFRNHRRAQYLAYHRTSIFKSWKNSTGV
jgi:hypothetical protein